MTSLSSVAEAANEPKQSNGDPALAPFYGLPSRPRQVFLGVVKKSEEKLDNFDKYQLASSAVQTKRIRLSILAFNQEMKQAQGSKQHLRQISECSFLITDPYSVAYTDVVKLFLVCDDGNLYRVLYNHKKFDVSLPEKVIELHPPRKELSMPPSVQFVSATCAVVCDGGRVLTVYETDCHRAKWTRFFDHRIVGPQAPECKPGCDRPPPGLDYGFTIADARLCIAKQQIEVCCRAVVKHELKPGESPSKADTFDNFIRWITIELVNPKVHHWTFKRARTIIIPGDMEMVGFDGKCNFLVSVSTHPPQLTSEEWTEKLEDDPLQAWKKEQEEIRNKNRVIYCWTEHEGAMHVKLRLEQEYAYFLTEDDIVLDVKTDWVKLSVRGETVLEGPSGGPIVVEKVTRRLRKNMETTRIFEFELPKADDTRWLEIIKNDTRGKYVYEGAAGFKLMLRSIELTAKDAYMDDELELKYWGADAGGSGDAMERDVDECEEMDAVPRFIWFLSERTNTVEHYCDLSTTPVLFSSRNFPPMSSTRLLCLRDGNDGHVFNFEVFPPRHCTVLKAFEAVSSSKSLRRWSAVSPHAGYATIIDTRTNGYVYWQTNGPTGGLQTLKGVRFQPHEERDNVCPMQVLTIQGRPGVGGSRTSLNDDDFILGFGVMEESLALLSRDTLVIHKMRERRCWGDDRPNKEEEDEEYADRIVL